MAQDEVLRLVARAKDEASGPLRKVRESLRSMKEGNEGPISARKAFMEWNGSLKETRDHIDKVHEATRRGLEPALDMLNLKTAAAASGVGLLVEGLKHFAERGDELTGFSNKVRLSIETVRGFDGIAEKFHVDPAELRQTEMTLVDSMYRVRKHRGEFYAYLKAQRPQDAAALAATPENEAGNEQALRITLRMLEQIKRERGEATARIFAKENFGSDALVDLIREGLPTLDEAIAKYRALSGAMDADKGESFAKAFSDFKASLEGLENQAGADFLPKITEGVKQLTEYVSGHKQEIEDGLVATVHDVGEAARVAWPAIRGVAAAANYAATEMGGWGRVLEGYAAFKLAGYALGFTRLTLSVLGLAAGFGRLASAARSVPDLKPPEAPKAVEPRSSVTGRKPTGPKPVEPVEVPQPGTLANDNAKPVDLANDNLGPKPVETPKPANLPEVGSGLRGVLESGLRGALVGAVVDFVGRMAVDRGVQRLAGTSDEEHERRQAYNPWEHPVLGPDQQKWLADHTTVQTDLNALGEQARRSADAFRRDPEAARGRALMAGTAEAPHLQLPDLHPLASAFGAALRALNPVSEAHGEELPPRPAFHPDDDRLTRARTSDTPAPTPSATDALFTLGSLGQEVKHLHGTLKDFATKQGNDGIVPASLKTDPGGLSSTSSAQEVIANGTYTGVFKALVDFANQSTLDKNKQGSGAPGNGPGDGVKPVSFHPGGGAGAGFSRSAGALKNAGGEFLNGRGGSVGSGDGTATTESAGAGFTAGMRARNLGNIGYFGQHEAGMIGPSNSRDVDHSIAMYATQEDGIRAAARLALRKYEGGMRNTAALIAGKNGWTPGALGPGASVNVARSMGLTNTDDLHLDRPDQMRKFLRGLATQEHGASGGRYYSEAMINRALSGSQAAAPGGGLGSAGNGHAVDVAEGMLGANGPQAAAALHSKMTPGEWCADFVNGVLKAGGGKGMNSSLASSFREWGTEVAKASIKRGDVLVKDHHVGIATGEVDQDGRVGMVSGNHGHRVGHSWESLDGILSARRAAVTSDAAAAAQAAADAARQAREAATPTSDPGSARQPGELTRRSNDAQIMRHKVDASGELAVKIDAPRGAKVAANGGGLFKKVTLNRGYSMTPASEVA